MRLLWCRSAVAVVAVQVLLRGPGAARGGGLEPVVFRVGLFGLGRLRGFVQLEVGVSGSGMFETWAFGIVTWVVR